MNGTMIPKAFIPLFLSSALLCSCSIPEKKVSKEEALALSHRVEVSLTKHDYSVLNNIFDEKALASRIAIEGGLFLNKELIKGGVQGFITEQFGKLVVQAMGKDGTYQLVKQYEKNDRQHLLFRLYGNGQINYHDYELIKREESIKAADMYIYISGENISKTLANALQLVNKDVSKKDIDKISTIKTIKQLIAQKDYEKAAQYYDEFPTAFKREKAFQLIHIQIYSKMSDEKYLQALLEYKSLFPNDPNMYLMMIDAYVLQKDYPRALESVNKLDSLIDKDPYQDYQRGLLYKLMKDSARAQECFERLHVNMPGFKKGTIELMEIYFGRGNRNKAVQLVERAKDSNYLSPSNLSVIYAYHPDLKKTMEEDSLRRTAK
ncbi:MAG TPA: hypothetical protein VE035_14425 [Puia sp.]|nr:hypothetical protein [Puia sp.]